MRTRNSPRKDAKAKLARRMRTRQEMLDGRGIFQTKWWSERREKNLGFLV